MPSSSTARRYTVHPQSTPDQERQPDQALQGGRSHERHGVRNQAECQDADGRDGEAPRWADPREVLQHPESEEYRAETDPQGGDAVSHSNLQVNWIATDGRSRPIHDRSAPDCYRHGYRTAFVSKCTRVRAVRWLDRHPGTPSVITYGGRLNVTRRCAYTESAGLAWARRKSGPCCEASGVSAVVKARW